MLYRVITVFTTSECADVVSLLLMDQGSEGVKIHDQNDIEEAKKSVIWDYDGISDVDSTVSVTGYFDISKDLEEIKSSLEELKKRCEGLLDCGTLELCTDQIDSSVFDTWKSYLTPKEIGDVAIIPLGKDYQGGKLPVVINIGKAFGTGSHETTSMCITLMQELELMGKEVADIGAGSGILGISALKKGAKHAVLTDIDPMAVEACNENLEYNGLDGRAEVITGSVPDGLYDVIFANITVDILISLLPQLVNRLKKNGALVLSGIIDGREKELEKFFGKDVKIRHMQEGQWHAYLLSF
jgi:ribosomal protein L11 methyltransferase